MSAIANMINKTQASASSAPASTRTASKKPIGNINVKLEGVNLFSRSVWADSTSESPVLNDLNELAKTDPENCALIVQKLLSLVTVEVTGKATTTLSLEDIMQSMLEAE